MKTLTSAMATEVAKTTGASFRLLMSITAPGGSARLISTEDITPTSGSAHTGELIAISEVDAQSSSVADTQVEIFDSALNRAAAKLGARVVVRLYAIGTDDSDADTVIDGTLSDPLSRAGGRISFDVVALAEKHERMIGRLLSQDDFSGAVTLDLGKALPNVIGTYERVEAVPVDAGAVTQLSLVIDDDDTTLELDDASAFPSSGTVQIDLEQMTFSGKSGNQLTGITRGSEGVPVAHAAGSNVAEIQTDYKYLIADHRIGQAPRVFIDGIRQVGVTDDLDGAISDSATSLAVTNAAAFPSKGSVYIGTEWIHYESITTNTLNSLTRAANGTTAAAHSDADPVEAVEWQIETSYQDSAAELATNGAFTADTGWTKGTGWDVDITTADKAHCDGSQVSDSDLEQDIALDVGKQYQIIFTISGYVAGTLTPVIGGTSGTGRTANGTYTEVITAGAGTTPRLELRANSTFNGDVDDVSVAAPYALLTFYAPPVLEKLGSIELTDTIDIDDPTHSHEGTSGTMTGAPGTVSLSGSNVITNPSNINASTGNYASQSISKGPINCSGTIAMSLTGSTTGRTPVSATIRVKASKNIVFAQNAAFGFGPSSRWLFNWNEFLTSNMSSPVTVSRTASVGTFAELQTLATSIIGPAISGSGTVDVIRLYTVEITNIIYQETGLQNAYTGVSKTGTVSISGNTTGSFVIGRNVSVDMDGLTDDDAGSVTGTGGLLVERPDHIVRTLLQQFGGALPAEVPSGTFDAFTGEELAFVFRGSQIEVRQVLDAIREQARAFIVFSGATWSMTLRPDDVTAIGTPDWTIVDANIIRAEDGMSSVTETVTGLREVVNRLHWRAGPRYDGGYEAAGREDDTTSQADYGIRETFVEYPNIFDGTQAQTIATWHASRIADPELYEVRCILSLAQYAMEVGDTATVTSTQVAGVSITGEVVAMRTSLSGDTAGTLEVVVQEAAP